MSPAIIRFSDDFPPGAKMGGKAGALASLSSAGLPIPEWLVVTSAAFDSKEKGFRLDPGLAQEIVATARELAQGVAWFAVRSSALEEDGTEHSFAGQLDSFLFVPVEGIPGKVEAVCRSGFSERIFAYRREHGFAGTPQLPAVLIQRMIDSDSAGVAFSADPVSGCRGHAVVSAVLGLGTALVSGEADADTLTVDRNGCIVARSIAEKHTAHRASPEDGEGVRPQPVPGAQASQPAITDEQAAAIAQLARATARHFGCPQDIEWALADGKLWLLQSRPITSLAALADPDGAIGLWDNANIAESYSGITTPLTFSFARGVYEAAYREFAKLMGVSTARIEENRDIFPRMLGLVQGRIYYNLINWYRLLALLPGFSINRGFMEQMMGVKEGLPEEVLAKLTPAGGWAKLRDAVALAGSCAGLIWNHLTLPGQIERFYLRLNTALRPCNPPLEEMRPDELVAHERDLERQLLLHWDAPLVNDFFAMIFYGLARKLAAKWCDDADGTLQNDLLCGEGGMISAEPAKRVREMAESVKDDARAVDTLCEGSPPAVRRWLETAPNFRLLYDAYVEKFGDRCLEELKLESLTLHDEPLVLMRSVGQYARRLAAGGPTGEAANETKLRTLAEARVAEKLKGQSLRRGIFNWVIAHARKRVRDRENLRFERTRLFGRVRRIYGELGKRFHASGRIAGPRDIFYLTVEEALGFVEGTASTIDLAGLTALRKREFDKFRDGPPPADRFTTRGAVHLGNTFQNEKLPAILEGDVLKGIGCCPGIVKAKARVIIDPRHAVIERGEILVAPRTDPGWIMLFPSAAGLLVEHGSLLSHSAIVARELGIPAIVSITGLTQWVKTGQWLEMDGSTGKVRKIESPSAP
ncbi:MAG TPA: PEP/pyruvate-binding domain-containing protein [Acidobacteriaceae bacterium]|jgi:pyruvate,water dikinase|nr:PEP/pyruvate-binding domain-containing protein [Acidobacteriaceae bacterium]